MSLGIADRSSQLAMHFGSQAFKEVAELVSDPNFSMEELDKRVRELGDRLNEDQRGVVDAIKSVRLKAYVAAAAKFRELKLNTSVPPWGGIERNRLLKNWRSHSTSRIEPRSNRQAAWGARIDVRLEPVMHPRYAALKAKYETNAGRFQPAAVRSRTG